MKHQLNLDYTIPSGDLAPYFESLEAGKALASKCEGCGAVAFPARAQCLSCDGKAMHWHPLSGAAQVIFRTDGAKGSFALVRFEGADTQSTVAIANSEQRSDFGKLTKPVKDALGLWVKLERRNDDVR